MVEGEPEADWAAGGGSDDSGSVYTEVVEHFDGIVGQVFEGERLSVVLRQSGAAAVVPDQLETVGRCVPAEPGAVPEG